MKKAAILVLAGLLFITNVFSQSLVWQNDEPKAGEKVSFTYNPVGSPLANEKNIEAVAFCINKTGGSAKEIDLKKTGNTYTGSFVTDTNTLLITMKLSADDKKDVNRNNGYMLAVRDKQGKMQPGTYNAFADQYAGYGNYLYGLDEQPDYAFNYRNQEWKEFPANRVNNMGGYLQALSTKKKKEAEPEILQILDDMVAAGNMNENQYNIAGNWYQRLKQKGKADSLKSEMKTKFPDGSWKKSEKLNLFYAEADPVKKEAILNDYVQSFPPATEDEKTRINYLYSALAGSFAETKPEEKRDFAKFKLYAEKLPMDLRASLYNDISWRLALKDTLLPLSKELSEVATKYARKEMMTPTAKKPALSTAKSWEEQRKDQYAMYADTYGFIMYKLQDYKTAFPYIKEAAVDIKKKKVADYNDRYALLLEKVATPVEVQKELEPLLKENKLGKEGKPVLQRALATNLQSQEKAEVYYASLISSGQEIARKELEKKMINEDASTFKLKNLQGEEVSLASLKGKVVVLDFWATWCGPCKASFPGMQKAIDKYKNNENVVFLFINTWENQETLEKRKKEVSDYITANKYNFNVLYDESPSGESSDYVVVNNYKVSGIPTKFILGKDGKMRFRSVGFGGGDDGLVDEISAMIDMAGK